MTASLLFAAASCAGSPTDSQAFGEGDPAIRTDAVEYVLEYLPGMFSVRIRVEYTNRTERTVYLHRSCGSGDRPHISLHRADGDTTGVWFDAGNCITQPLRPPIPVRSGATYADSIVLTSSESPNAYPPITMAMRTGVFQLAFDIQESNRVVGWGGVDLLPFEQRVSNVFEILRPE